MANVTKFLKSVSRIKQIKIIKLFKERYLKAMTNKNINIKYLIKVEIMPLNKINEGLLLLKKEMENSISFFVDNFL